jgi:hypothetical protein
MTTLEKRLEGIEKEFNNIAYDLDERRVRIWCAAKAKAYDREHGRGGVMAVHKATGVSRPRIYGGLKEIESGQKLEKGRVRRPGGGRKKITEKQPGILEDLEKLVEPLSRGDPESPLRWTCKSTYQLRDELMAQGYTISQPQVGKLLELEYSLQAPSKTQEGGSHPDRDAQFNYINEQVKAFQARGLPAISVDTKKKENIGNYANKGREYHKKGQPPQVKVYDFVDKKSGKVAPYGIYDMGKNEGFVNVGISHDTAEFAVNSIRTWKIELQKLADELDMNIHVCHFPPGTSKWNKIEHKMFCYITKNWRGRPLSSRETVVNLIGNTTTTKGLKIKAILDENVYEKGRKVTDEELAAVNIEYADFHGEWNYTIKPPTMS